MARRKDMHRVERWENWGGRTQDTLRDEKLQLKTRSMSGPRPLQELSATSKLMLIDSYPTV